jgi:hypothetical protein
MRAHGFAKAAGVHKLSGYDGPEDVDIGFDVAEPPDPAAHTDVTVNVYVVMAERPGNLYVALLVVRVVVAGVETIE